MKLSAAILLLGALALPVLLAAQFRWLRLPRAEFRRRRARLLWIAALLFPLLSIAHCRAVRMETPRPPPGYTTVLPARGDAPEPKPPPLRPQPARTQ